MWRGGGGAEGRNKSSTRKLGPLSYRLKIIPDIRLFLNVEKPSSRLGFRYLSQAIAMTGRAVSVQLHASARFRQLVDYSIVSL